MFRSSLNASTLLTILAVVLTTFMAFHETLDHEFVNWDDPMFVTENASIQKLDADHLVQIFTTTEAGAYTPLSRLSLALDVFLWKRNPFGFHLSALLLHSLNALLVFQLARLLIRWTFQDRPDVHPNFGALVAALLFSIHPLRVESVAWISERRDVLSGSFGLLTVLTYLRYATTPSSDSKHWFVYTLTLLTLIAGALSKGVVITLPAVFILLDIYPLKRLSYPFERKSLKILAEKIPFFLFSLWFGVSLLHQFYNQYLAFPLRDVGWGPRWAQSISAEVWYLGKIVWPLNLNPLNLLYARLDFGQPSVLLASFWLAILFTGFGLIWKRHPSGMIAWLSHLVIIAPFLGLAQSGLQFASDRYTYLASVPLCLLIGGTLTSIRYKTPRNQLSPAIPIAAFILAIFFLLTFTQVRIWQNSETLWTHSLKIDSKNPIAWNNLGEVAAAKHDLKNALIYFDRAASLLPNYLDALYNLGNTHAALGQDVAAERVYTQILEKRPQHPETLHNRGWIRLKLNLLEKASSDLEKALSLKPSPATLCVLAQCRELQKRPQDASKLYERAAHQKYPEAWAAWGRSALRANSVSRAMIIFEEGLRSTNSPIIKLALAEALLSERPTPQHRARARKILQELDLQTRGQSAHVKELLRKTELVH